MAPHLVVGFTRSNTRASICCSLSREYLQRQLPDVSLRPPRCTACRCCVCSGLLLMQCQAERRSLAVAFLDTSYLLLSDACLRMLDCVGNLRCDRYSNSCRAGGRSAWQSVQSTHYFDVEGSIVSTPGTISHGTILILIDVDPRSCSQSWPCMFSVTRDMLMLACWPQCCCLQAAEIPGFQTCSSHFWLYSPQAQGAQIILEACTLHVHPCRDR